MLDDLPPVVGAETSWVLVAICADKGHAAEAVATADAGYAISTRCSGAPHMRFNIADAHVGALLLAGSVNAALQIAERERRIAAELPGAAHVLGVAIAGRAAVAAGRLDAGCLLLQQSIRSFAASGHDIGWGYRYRIPLTAALAMRGSTQQAVETLAELDELHRPFRSLGYELSLARAWVAGSQGALSEAIGILRSAAETAAANGSFAAEVMCLQAAVQFGDRTCEPRLSELRTLVEGPRVGLAARFATALANDDAAELSSVSVGFENVGDLVAAIDAAAHATMAYRRKDLRGSALGSAARAEAMAQRCRAETPILRQACEPLPLTDREREIVLLIGHGMHNRDIAERLFLSIRTVEDHIYKSMNKTGTATREELAALLCHPAPPEDP